MWTSLSSKAPHAYQHPCCSSALSAHVINKYTYDLAIIRPLNTLYLVWVQHGPGHQGLGTCLEASPRWEGKRSLWEDHLSPPLCPHLPHQGTGSLHQVPPPAPPPPCRHSGRPPPRPLGYSPPASGSWRCSQSPRLVAAASDAARRRRETKVCPEWGLTGHSCREC